MSWLELTLTVGAAELERLESILAPFEPLAITVTDASGEPVFEPPPGTSVLWNSCRVKALFDAGLNRVALKTALGSVGIGSGEFSSLADGDWTECWRAHAVRARVADRLWLVPRDDPPPGEPCLKLEPGLAFGSGSHPTTWMCLEWLAGQPLERRSVLDYGCGSGILGLAALKLGCERVLAIDHDPQALLATQENAAYNGIHNDGPMSGRLQTGFPEVLKGQRFHVVLANILAGPLVELAPVLTGALRPGGTLVISGLLESQVADVLAAYTDIEFEPPRLLEDDQAARWACVVGTAPATGRPDAEADSTASGPARGA